VFELVLELELELVFELVLELVLLLEFELVFLLELELVLLLEFELVLLLWLELEFELGLRLELEVWFDVDRLRWPPSLAFRSSIGLTSAGSDRLSAARTIAPIPRVGRTPARTRSRLRGSVFGDFMPIIVVTVREIRMRRG
jgi:hypothetical protein